MANGKKYTDALVNIENTIDTHMGYINNHLGNIDKQLEKQNTRLNENEKQLAKNTTNIKWFVRIVSTVGGGSGITALINYLKGG